MLDAIALRDLFVLCPELKLHQSCQLCGLEGELQEELVLRKTDKNQGEHDPLSKRNEK
jgi:hypothetical protein